MPEFGRSPPDYLNVKVAAGTIAREDADLILRFVTEEANRIGHKQHTILSNTRYISHIVEHIPNPRTWTNDQINQYVSDVRRDNKPNTSRKRILLIKQFCVWLVGNKLNKSLKLPGIKAIKAPPADRMTKTSAMMLGTDEIDKIIAAGRNTRDRCLLSVLAESGMRPFESLRLTWGELKIDEFGVVINVSGKTGVPRFIRLVHSTPFIVQWRNDSPFTDDNAYIFTSLKTPRPDVRITHSALKKILRLAVKRTGNKKTISPYLFRHSSVTRMLEEGYSDSTIRMVHWGSQKTSMLSTYGHVSPQAIDNEILDKAGIKNADKKKERKQPTQCPSCHTIVKPTDEYCRTCGASLTQKAIERDQTTKGKIENTPQFKAAFAAALAAIEHTQK
jgi:integrase/recombinase XerD